MQFAELQNYHGQLSRRVRTTVRYKFRTGNREPVYLEDDEIQRIFAFARQYKPRGVPFGVARNVALLVTAVHTGLRVRELHFLDWEDVDLEHRWLRVQRGKGNKYRRVPLTQEATAALKLYSSESGLEKGPVFVSRLGKRMAIRTIQWVVEQYGARSGIKKVVDKREKKLSPHKLRHTFGTQLARRNVQQVKIQDLMGHASRTTTDKYVHAAGSHEDVEKLSEAAEEDRLQRLEDKFDLLLQKLDKET